jgi:hypothetical protein
MIALCFFEVYGGDMERIKHVFKVPKIADDKEGKLKVQKNKPAIFRSLLRQIKDEISSYGLDNINIPIELKIGLVPDDSYELGLLEELEIREQALEELWKKELIKELRFSQAEEDVGLSTPQINKSASFVINPEDIRRLEEFLQTLLSKDKYSKPTRGARVQFDGAKKEIRYGDNRQPMGGGLAYVFNELFSNRKEIVGGVVKKKGKPSHVDDLLTIGEYGDETKFRSALKSIVNKVGQGFPISIENTKRRSKLYQMTVTYEQ